MRSVHAAQVVRVKSAAAIEAVAAARSARRIVQVDRALGLGNAKAVPVTGRKAGPADPVPGASEGMKVRTVMKDRAVPALHAERSVHQRAEAVLNVRRKSAR